MICIGLYPILFNFKSIIILEHIISISEQYEYFLSKDMEIVYMLLACFVNIFFLFACTAFTAVQKFKQTRGVPHKYFASR